MKQAGLMRRKATAAAAIVALLTGVAPVALCGEVTLTFQQGDPNGYAGTRDTFLDSDQPDNSRRSETFVGVDSGVHPSKRDDGLLVFSGIFGSGPNQIPLGSEILEAKLTLDVLDDSAISTTVHRMLGAWQDTDTWNMWGDGVLPHNTEPGVQADDSEADGVPDANLLLPVGMGMLEIDVKARVQDWSNGSDNYGWVFLAGNESPDGWHFSSSEATDPLLRPMLRVVIPEPLTLSLLALGGLAVMRKRRRG